MSEFPELPSSLQDPGEPIQLSQSAEYKWIKPALGRYVLKEIPPEERRKGSGLFLVNLTPQSGNICAVKWVCEPYESGQNDQDPSKFGPNYKVGDVVIIAKFHGLDVTINDETFIICQESDILGELRNDEPPT